MSLAEIALLLGIPAALLGLVVATLNIRKLVYEIEKLQKDLQPASSFIVRPSLDEVMKYGGNTTRSRIPPDESRARVHGGDPLVILFGLITEGWPAKLVVFHLRDSTVLNALTMKQVRLWAAAMKVAAYGLLLALASACFFFLSKLNVFNPYQQSLMFVATLIALVPVISSLVRLLLPKRGLQAATHLAEDSGSLAGIRSQFPLAADLRHFLGEQKEDKPPSNGGKMKPETSDKDQPKTGPSGAADRPSA
jgi:hypothetical protein